MQLELEDVAAPELNGLSIGCFVERPLRFHSLGWMMSGAPTTQLQSTGPNGQIHSVPLWLPPVQKSS